MIFKSDGLDQFYQEKGNPDSPAILFIHAFPLSRAMWDSQVAALSDSFRVIAYDLRGMGKSQAGTGQYTLDTYADDCIALLDHLQINEAIICGLSLGGYIALRTIERHPTRFKKLILADTKSEADGNEAKVKRFGMIQKIQLRGVTSFTQDFVKGVFLPETFQKKPELIQATLDMIHQNDPIGVIGALLAMAARTDTTESLSKIKVPTLVLVGEKDGTTPPDGARKMAAAIQGSQFQIIPNAAHMSNLENPGEFNRVLKEFLQL